MAANDFNFPHFSGSSAESLRFMGTAGIIKRIYGAPGISNGVLRLTPNDGGCAGACWYGKPVDFSHGFETSFTFQISEPTGLGADGFAFVLQNDPSATSAIGGSGHLLGYSDIHKSFAVIFDTYDNGCGSDNRVGVNLDGDISETGIASLHLPRPELSQGEHAVTVRLSPPVISPADTGVNPDRVPIFGSGSQRDLSVHLDGEHLLTARLDAALISPKFQGYVGFTAATGGAGENHDILSWSYNATQEGTL